MLHKYVKAGLTISGTLTWLALVSVFKGSPTLKPGADDRNDIVFVSFLLRFCFVLGTFSDRYTIVFRT